MDTEGKALISRSIEIDGFDDIMDRLHRAPAEPCVRAFRFPVRVMALARLGIRNHGNDRRWNWMLQIGLPSSTPSSACKDGIGDWAKVNSFSGLVGAEIAARAVRSRQKAPSWLELIDGKLRKTRSGAINQIDLLLWSWTRAFRRQNGGGHAFRVNKMVSGGIQGSCVPSGRRFGGFR